MRKRQLALILGILMLLSAFNVSAADDEFIDEEFQGRITTETLDAIIRKYELNDGWYWTTQADTEQDFHGHPQPGWTDTSVNVYKRTGFISGWYGCRWGRKRVNPRNPNDAGYGECYGFAQFIGYLLSGVRNVNRNTEGKWKVYGSIRRSGGFQPGDILRAVYEKDGKKFSHSAVVYSVTGDRVLFMQVSGGNYNLLRIRTGYTDGNLKNETSVQAVGYLPHLRIYRYEP